MEVVHLPPGEAAAPEADCIRLHQLADGRVRLEGSLLEGDESISLARSFYASIAAAEAAGMAWADGHGVMSLSVALLGPEELDGE